MPKTPKTVSIFGKIEGEQQLLQALAMLPDAAEKKVFLPALRKAAKGVLWEIQRRAPVDDEAGGDLYRSFKVRAIPRSRVKIGSRVIVDRKTLKMTGREGFYAAMQELGWKPGRRGTNSTNKPVKGKRFMREGLYQHEQAVKATIIREVKRELPHVVREVKRKASKGGGPDLGGAIAIKGKSVF